MAVVGAVAATMSATGNAEPATRKAIAKDGVSATQPPRYAPDRPAERLGGLRVRLAFEVAQHHGQAVTLRQAREFLVDDGGEFGGFEVI